MLEIINNSFVTSAIVPLMLSATSELHGKALIKNYFDSKSDNPENWQKDKELLSLYAKTKDYDVAVFDNRERILTILSKYKK